VSGALRHRSRRRRFVVRLVLLAACGLATAALAAGLQVHALRISGVRRFAPREVETALQFALGTPTVAMRADTLREAVRAVPWVADARVSVSIDGVVSCAVVERQPVAIAVDGGTRAMVDAEGTLLGPPTGAVPALELHGFAADAAGRAAVLATAAAAERAWGARIVRAERLGPCDVLFLFADTACIVVADPAHPEGLACARRVLTAWTAQVGAAPLRLDARVAERVAVTPAPPAPPAEGTVS